jgi:(4S)-4-hydroxy-5-phosphonooxypentane-2,3-dione isomerase
MLIVCVDVLVKPECREAFREATLVNARQSVQEPGMARFDVLEDREHPEHFRLIEVYRTAEDPARHKETTHYQTWRDAVAPMMAVPRTSGKFTNLYPGERGFDAAVRE